MTTHPPAPRLVDTPERGMNYLRIYVDSEPGQRPFTYLKRMVAAARRVGGNGWFIGYRSALPPVDRRFHVESGAHEMTDERNPSTAAREADDQLPGLYHVEWGGRWTVAEFAPVGDDPFYRRTQGWIILGDSMRLGTSDFDAIGQRIALNDFAAKPRAVVREFDDARLARIRETVDRAVTDPYHTPTPVFGWSDVSFLIGMLGDRDSKSRESVGESVVEAVAEAIFNVSPPMGGSNIPHKPHGEVYTWTEWKAVAPDFMVEKQRNEARAAVAAMPPPPESYDIDKLVGSLIDAYTLAPNDEDEQRDAVNNCLRLSGWLPTPPPEREIELGAGRHVVNHGTYNGKTAIFIETASTPGPIGGDASDCGLDPHSVSQSGLVISFGNPESVAVLRDALDIASPPPERKASASGMIARSEALRLVENAVIESPMRDAERRLLRQRVRAELGEKADG